MKNVILTAILAAASLAASAQRLPMNEYVDRLMSKMTLDEKIGQLNLVVAGNITTGGAVDTKVSGDIAQGRVGGVFNIKGFDGIRMLQQVAVKKSRLHIPLLVGMDVIHGYETIFPIPLAQSCSWDTLAIENGARIAAREASADGINWTFSPMVDISLDARWGRCAEGEGEDPFLGSAIARAMVRGYQGDFSAPSNIMACLKHFALYGAVEAGKEYNTVDMSRVRMYNQYLPPYKAAVEAGVGSVMSSFNLVDGVPATGNHWLLTDLLRHQWGFKGFVTTDYASIAEMTVHGVGDLKSVSAQALKAGTDMDMVGYGFINTLTQSVKDGTVAESDIDTACRRVLEAKYRLGLFDDPYRFCNPKRRKTDIFTSANRKAARDMAAETFVLLKNDGAILPLARKGKIALVGPLADNRPNMAGTWCVAYTPDRYSTLREGFERALKGRGELLYAQGCNLFYDAREQSYAEFGKTIKRGDDAAMKAEALRIAADADVIVCAMGESAEMSGESASRSSLTLPDTQMDLLQKLYALGKPIVLLNFAGRATVMKWESEHIPAIMNVWFGGSETADAVCDVLFGDKSPSGKLTVSMPQSVGQEPLYYNHLPTGRPVPDGTKEFRKYQSNYLDVRNDALYPFGYGLSYTTFAYSDIRLSSGSMRRDGHLTATVTVTNTGKRDADEIVQMYIHDRIARISRPVKELKGFSRISLKACESRDVTFDITPELLKYYDSDLRYTLDPGQFDLMIGPDSRNVKSVMFTVE